jgi:hypothetical protein
MMTQVASTGSTAGGERCRDGLEEAQDHTEYLIAGRRHPRVPNGRDARCADCGAGPGELHEAGCEMEVCPRCGDRVIACECAYGARRSSPPKAAAAS